MQRHFIVVISSFLFILASSALLFVLFVSPSHANCPSEKTFADAYEQQQFQQLRGFAKQLDACTERTRDKRRYYIASALYEELVKTVPESQVRPQNYDEIRAIHPYFWKALVDLGDFSMKSNDYVGGLRYYQDALFSLDSCRSAEKAGDISDCVHTPIEEKIPADYILALKAKADNAKLLANLNGHVDETLRRNANGKPQGMYSFQIRGVSIACHKYPIYFDYKGFDIRGNDLKNTQQLYKVFHDNNDPDIVLTGHTDPIGSDAYNDELSIKRAQSIKDYLVKRGYNGSIKIVGKGKREEVKMMVAKRKSLDEAQWQQLNRRVEACKQ